MFHNVPEIEEKQKFSHPCSCKIVPNRALGNYIRPLFYSWNILHPIMNVTFYILDLLMTYPHFGC